MDLSLVFDIGMHRGEDTAYYLWRGHRVVAFEANPTLVAECRERFADALASGRLTIHSGVLRGTDAAEFQTFFVNRSHSDWGTAIPAWRDRNAFAFRAESDAVTVPVVDLRKVICEVGVPFYAKIDIEGLDHEMLRAFEVSPERPKFISIESAKTSWEDLQAEIDLLVELGYTRFAAVQQRRIPGSSTHGFRFQRHASGPFGDDIKNWTDISGIISQYRQIFREYGTWGDNSWLQRTFGRLPIAALQTLIRLPLPGWYDTHARRD